MLHGSCNFKEPMNWPLYLCQFLTICIFDASESFLPPNIRKMFSYSLLGFFWYQNLLFWFHFRIHFVFKERKKRWPSFPWLSKLLVSYSKYSQIHFPCIVLTSCHSLSVGDLDLSLSPTILYTISWTWKPETIAACGWTSLGLSTPRNSCFFLSLRHLLSLLFLFGYNQTPVLSPHC